MRWAEPRGTFLRYIARSKVLGEKTETPFPPQVDLPQTITSGIVTLQEEHVALARGINVGDTPTVDDDFGGPFEAANGPRNLPDRGRCLGPRRAENYAKYGHRNAEQASAGHAVGHGALPMFALAVHGS
jgi:hypothetical protein